jgi:zinc/manganese transport system substrate-binding protein
LRTGEALIIAIVASVIVAVFVAAAMGWGKTQSPSSKRGLLVVVTFPNLADDVNMLLCSDDKVVSLAPPGADPHSYQLRPSDVELVKSADVVVSTGHAPFEIKLRTIVEEKKLVEVPRIPGIRLFTNPVTGKPNYHMPIYDPSNYRLFIDYLAEKLASARPECRQHYLAAAARVERRLEAIIKDTPRLNVQVVGSLPPVQYALNWLGVRVVWLLVPEPGTAPSPQTVRTAERLLAEGAYAAVTTIGTNYASNADAKLAAMAKELGRPVIRVPAPFAKGSILEKIEAIVREVSALAPGAH